MFERYDELARQTLFFARYEATRLGVRSIETEHLLLSLMREPRGPAGRLLLSLPLADIRNELETSRTGEKISASVEIPFSAETKRVLQHACDEADALNHRHIGPEHLLLGLMREPDSRAATALTRRGVRLEDARKQIQELASAAAVISVSKAAVQAQLDRIVKSATQLSMSLSGDPAVSLQTAMLLQELETLRSLLDEQP